MYASSGVSGEGFDTTVQPASSAGRHLDESSSRGAFHGVMAAQTPTGSFTTLTLPPSSRFLSSTNG